jgi:hypothetical protein
MLSRHNAALQLRAHSTHIRDIVAARYLQALLDTAIEWKAFYCSHANSPQVTNRPISEIRQTLFSRTTSM